MIEEKQLNHWDLAIKTIKELAVNGEPRLTVRYPTMYPNEEISLEIWYHHIRFGSRMDKIILFRDGSWRYIPQ